MGNSALASHFLFYCLLGMGIGEVSICFSLNHIHIGNNILALLLGREGAVILSPLLVGGCISLFPKAAFIFGCGDSDHYLQNVGMSSDVLAVSNCPIIYDKSISTYFGTCHADSKTEWFGKP